MFKTIKSRMIIMQTITIFFILGILFVLFSAFAEDYYFSRKIGVIKQSLNTLQKEDISTLTYKNRYIISYEEQKLRFVIANEKFEPIYVTSKTKNFKPMAQNAKAKAKVENSIVSRLYRFSEKEIVTNNGVGKISGREIITQNGNKYYLYVYELKSNMKIHLSYYKLFFGIMLILVAVVGVIVSVVISNRICKPIRQIEENTKLAVKNNFELNINENQEFVELSGLAHSINIMLSKIREQITELENEIENKTKVENLRKQFVNNVSHEMKTPIAIISSQVEMLELLQDKQKKKEYCQSIIEETENMSQMINDMIVIYSMQSAEEELMVVSADINELVEFTCRDYDKLFFAKNISLHESYTEKCMAEVNERFFTQAVSNYITNAIKHCKEEGNVYVRVMSGENNIKVEVENDGKHIPEENIENIWNMFYQGNDSATLNGQKGSGLGLYLVKSIVELHHGKYGCENVENGVVFYIELPKVQKSN